MINFTNTKDGAGNITGLILKEWIEASQIINDETPNRMGGKIFFTLVNVELPIKIFNVQATIQNIIESKKKLFIGQSTSS